MIAFAASGAILSFFELLGVILACNLATIMKEQNAEKKRMAKNAGGGALKLGVRKVD